MLSAFESLRWEAGGTSEENDEGVRAAVGRQCRQSSVVVVKETRLAEVTKKSKKQTACVCKFFGNLYVPTSKFVRGHV